MMKMIITTAGRQALINAEATGTNSVKITHIGVGSGRYTAAESQTALQSEIKRLPIIEGGATGDSAFHVAYKDESKDAYSVHEFGLFLDNGILFAVYSQTEVIIQKIASGVVLLAADVSLTDIDVSQITFGEVTFSNPAATEETPGILAVATAEEVHAGEAKQKALTPDNIQHLTSTETRKGIIELATKAEATTGADATRAITPATAKAILDARIATSAETIAGTNTSKAVSPAGLAALTSTSERKGLIETATTAETLAGTDATRAVTPAGLQAKIEEIDVPASETEEGFIQLASNAEAIAGTNATKAMTPSTTNAAIQNFKGALNSAMVTATGATTARSLANRFADDITPQDFGAKGNGTVDDTAAFTAFEAKISGRDVDLEGLTYLVTSRPTGNNYYNGFFKIGTETIKPIFDFYKFGGTAERFLNVKRDFSESQRGGAALLGADFVRSGAGAGAVVQSAAWDDANRYLYTLHTTTGDLGVVNRFSTMKLGAGIVNTASAYTTASAYIGHQGLAVEYRDGGTVKLWASMAYETAGAPVTSKGTKAVRFSAPTATNQNIDDSVEIFNLFPEVASSSQATTVCISYSGKYLIAKYSVANTNKYRVRIFKVADLTTAGDYSKKYLHEFEIELTRDASTGVTKALQGMACDDRYIYFLAAAYGYAEKHSIYVADMFGNVVDEYRDLSVGKEIGKDVGTTYYEPQSLFFMSLNGQPKLVMQIATGDTAGSRLCHLVALNVRQSYYFPVGTGTASKHGVAIDEQARIVNTEGAANLSLYPSGLSQSTQARSGANQQALARFSDDTAGSSIVFLKSRGGTVGVSKSAIAGDIIGQLHFLVDNGNIDYSGTVQGARAGYIEGGVFESSTLSTAGTENIGVRGYLRFYTCSDANSRSGVGVELIDNTFRPLADNVHGLGTAQRRWKAVYAATDVISTSDENMKQDVAEIPAKVLAAWRTVDFRQFRFKDEVAKEGDDAKIYFGVIAQRILEAFEAAGIDACAYGLVCKETLEDGSTLYGVRYREALALEAAAARQDIALKADKTANTLGSSATAKDNNCIALGHSATGSGGYSTAVGHSATAIGFYSTAVGYNATASGGYSTALGHSATASYEGSVALGMNAKASGTYSTALGRSASAKDSKCIALGYAATASHEGSVALGMNATGSGFSTALGRSASASGFYSTAVGYNATAFNEQSSAVGYYASASGFYSTALGSNAHGMDYSTALGDSTFSGYRSTAVGCKATASNEGSVALGMNATASGSYATALGYSAMAKLDNSTALFAVNPMAQTKLRVVAVAGATLDESYFVFQHEDVISAVGTGVKISASKFFAMLKSAGGEDYTTTSEGEGGGGGSYYGSSYGSSSY